MRENFDFWKDAADAAKEFIKDGFEESIIKHMHTRKFNDNEARLFSEYLAATFEVPAMNAYLEWVIEKENEECNDSK